MDPTAKHGEQTEAFHLLGFNFAEPGVEVSTLNPAKKTPDTLAAFVCYPNQMSDGLARNQDVNQELDAWAASLQSFGDLQGYAAGQFSAWVSDQDLSDHMALSCGELEKTALTGEGYSGSSSSSPIHTYGTSEQSGSSNQRSNHLISGSERSASSVQFLGHGSCEVENPPCQQNDANPHSSSRLGGHRQRTPPPGYVCKRCRIPGSLSGL